MSNLAPFSIFEFITVFSPLWVAIALFFILFAPSYKVRGRILKILSLLLLFLALFFLIVGVGGAIGQGDAPSVSSDELVRALLYLKDEINASCFAEYPEFSEISEKLYFSYKELHSLALSVFSTKPQIKFFGFPKVFSKMKILASYSFFTSEISVNPLAPRYTAVFSAAHEMAHLFGVFCEGEANFYAYLSLVKTENSALVYSASLNAFEYLGRELNAISPDAYRKIYSALSVKALSDMKEYVNFYSSVRGVAAQASDKANSVILNAFDKLGSESYDKFTCLLVPYLNSSVSP